MRLPWKFTLPVAGSAGIGSHMRLSIVLLFFTAVSVEAGPFRWPWTRSVAEGQEKKEAFRFPLMWNSRTKEQQRLNAATASKPTSREEQVMKPDLTKEFNPSSANFGSGRSITGKNAATNEFHFVNRTRTKTFAPVAFVVRRAGFEATSADELRQWFSQQVGKTQRLSGLRCRWLRRGLPPRSRAARV